MAHNTLKLLDLPGMRDLERRCTMLAENRLYKDEIEQLEGDLVVKSLELFGISRDDTEHYRLPNWSKRTDSMQDWEENFEYIEYEDLDAASLDVTDDEGRVLQCLDHFDRQLICALKKLHPLARLAFRDEPLTRDQADATARAWGEALVRRGKQPGS